ncbi:hypothetical protein [Maridesulfovibrio salexigens]|uniref:Uncharacterized protein n=1 Tax=Maridesulfovibrio salexigens (strain ATCC 14822 / DSM 2638 / NCIMB 8403 / VKM B-1763) TaxID=526222 RepID=C6C112_MARSD|nr:hypothetical protein [Maridesulfovibrio salexigens]ACS79175.1 hypothetical protein Desal_1111 [Maridesulfovibrio salexigens DSM 2638]
MTGEGVEAIIVMLVIVLAIFKMVKRTGNGLGQPHLRDEREKKEMDSNE